MHPVHQMFEIGEIPCAGIALGVQGINRSKDAPLFGWHSPPRRGGEAEGPRFARRIHPFSARRGIICSRWGRDHECLLAFDLNLVISKLEFSAAELPIPCDHHRFDFALAQFIFASNKCLRYILEFLNTCANRSQDQEQRLRIGFARLLRHIEVGSLNAIEPGQFQKFTAGSPTLHLSVGPSVSAAPYRAGASRVRPTVGTAAFGSLFERPSAGSPTLHLSVGPTVRPTVGTAAFGSLFERPSAGSPTLQTGSAV